MMMMMRARVLQALRPRIHVTESDFASITHGGALCRDGALGPAEFEAVIREQVPPRARAPAAQA